MNDMFENIETIDEAASITGIAGKTFRNWRYKGLYPQIFVKLGGKVFVDLNELKNIMDEQQAKAKKVALRHDL